MEVSPNLSLMVFAINENTERLLEPLIAKGYGYKTNSVPVNIFEEIKNSSNTGSLINDSLVNKIIVLFNNKEDEKKDTKTLLSEREIEVLTEIAKGKQYKEIAEMLFISAHTVHFHIKNIYRKFNIHSQFEAVNLAAKYGLV